ncbi:MAG: PD-(D/E)XK nuclease family protein, partial [Cyclobacteriaceae bacterium]|nr:PD-(D/E)XK nuclease family protein [Cyclobacteriaceae bacterium]
MQVREIYGKEMAPNFNSLDFWRIDENKISQIIAYFLDPKEKHGQGEVYLENFLKRFDLDFFQDDDLPNTNVVCEASIDNRRRIDILITNRFGQCIGIENKIHLGTADQKDQIKDYVTYLEGRYKNGNCLIYLSPKEKEVSEHSISKVERE